MTGRKTTAEPGDPGRRDWRETEDVGRRDGSDETIGTETQVDPRGDADADGDGRPEPTIGSSDDLGQDVKTELEKDLIRPPR